jgi:hypothetical protein
VRNLKYYIDPRRREIFHQKQIEGRLTGLTASYAETTF